MLAVFDDRYLELNNKVKELAQEILVIHRSIYQHFLEKDVEKLREA